MKEITVSARTLSDAITEALIELEITSDMLEYDVIEKGSEGFFGIGRKQAVIKARKKVVKPPKEEIKKEEPEAPAKEKPKKEFKKEPKKESRKEHKEHKEQKEFKKDAARELHREVKETVAPVKEEEKEPVKLAEISEETKTACVDFLKGVFETMNLEVEIVTEIDEEGALAIELKGKHMGILIGKRGQTLDALQYLTNRVANKNQEGFVRVKLDTENYRKRRKETLENLAKNIASKVKRTRKPVSLEPMNPYERRIIHSALQADRYVSTHSEGEEPYRRVVVTPNRK